MSSFSFTISAADVITLGYTGSLINQEEGSENEGTVEITFDRGFTRSSQHRVLTASFGDGYEQRVLDGINTKNETFNVSFNNRPAEDVNLIAAYFDLKAGKAFDLSITNLSGNETVRVVCENYNTNYIYEDYHSLTATLRRVYEP